MNNRGYNSVLICFGDPATDARTLNIAGTLASNGRKAAVIAPESQAGRETLNAKGIDYYPVKIPKGRVFIKWYAFNNKVIRIADQLSAQNVFAMDLYSLVPGTKLKTKLSSKLIYDAREIYSALGTLSGQNLKQHAVSAIENMHTPAVDEFIVTGQLDAEYLKEHFKSAKPFHLVMNLPPKRLRALSSKLSDLYPESRDTFKLIYQGELLDGRGILTTMRAVKLTDNTSFFIIGSGPQENKLKHKAAELGLEGRTFFTGKVPYEMLHDYTLSADAGMALFRPLSLSYELALPNKIFEYIMAGKPYISTGLPAIKQLTEKFNTGILTGYDPRPVDIADAINRLKDKTLYDNLAANAENASSELNFESQIDTILSISG
ncbi:MAG: glycosyltransferase [Bacteroidota bacterium]